MINPETCLKCQRKILGWTIIGNAFLAGLKITSGTIANSSGLVADGFQSLSCVLTSIFIAIGIWFSKRRSDNNFPYGYEKVEFIVSFSAFSILIGIGAFIALSSLLGIFKRDFTRPDIMILPIAVASAFLAYMMSRYNFCAGVKLNSPGMIANGSHAGADLFSSSAVIIGIILSQTGPQFIFCDKLAAFIVGAIIIRDSLGHWSDNLKILLDFIPEDKITRKLSDIVRRVNPGYRLSELKFKRTGNRVWVKAGLFAPQETKVSEYELTVSKAKSLIKKEIPGISEIECFISILNNK
ncbi:MAG: cation transporter [Candidatus Omnitrophica bacterium]|nr:cation transporter [Candidatus Omnitrophota bacterium]